MHETGGGPAFPGLVYDGTLQINKDGILVPTPTDSHPGMSLRQYYKAHAPTKIPTWFQHVEPSKLDIPDMPDWTKLETEEHRSAALSWVNDPCWDLRDSHPELAWFQDQAEAHWMVQQAWEWRDLIARAQQWPGYWADMMLEEDDLHNRRTD